MNRVEAVDSVMISLNLLIAGLVIFIPFSTRAMSDFATADLPLPTALYAANIAAGVLAQLFMMEVAIRRGLITTSERTQRVADFLGNLVVPVTFLASIPIAYIAGGNTAKFVWLIAAIVAPISGWYAQRTGRKE